MKLLILWVYLAGEAKVIVVGAFLETFLGGGVKD